MTTVRILAVASLGVILGGQPLTAQSLSGQEAPQREVDRQKKEVADALVSREKARATNKAAFRP
jgi:hypothetical protein